MATLAEHKASLKSANSTLTKMVNGAEVELSTSEYNAMSDEWAQADYDKEVEDTIIADGGASANYKNIRRNAYPSFEDQLDDMYHNGFDAWKATIKAVKDKYPKP